MTQIDYEDRLLDYIESLDIDYPVYTDSNDIDSSISVVRMPGSRTVSEDFEGNKDKAYKYFVQLKCDETERQKAVQALELLADELDDVIDIPSQNNSYEYLGTTISNEPYFMGQNTEGGLFFRFLIETELSIYKEEN